jgi:hypothetical protein
MDHDGLFGGKHTVQVRHRRMKRKEVVELERRRFAVERQCIPRAQSEPIRIADRRYCRKTVQGTAKDDRKKTRIATLGLRELRHSRRLAGRERAFEMFYAHVLAHLSEANQRT